MARSNRPPTKPLPLDHSRSRHHPRTFDGDPHTMKKTTRRLLSAFSFAASIQSPALAADQPSTLNERLAPPPGGGLTADQVAARARETSLDAAASHEAMRAAE